MTQHDIGPFRVEGATERIRTVVAAGIVIVLGEPVLTGLARWADPEILHKAISVWANMTVRFLDMQVDVEGLHHVDCDQGYVVAPLHEGFADPLLLTRLPLRLRYLVRDELFDWAHLGRFLRTSDQIEVAAASGARELRQLLGHCRDVLDRGESLVVFPQGSILGVEVAFTRGAFVLADRLARPLLPVVMTGTHRVWEHPYSPTLRYGQRVSMRVLPAIPAGEALTSMSEVESQMKTIALANTDAPVRHFDPERDGYWDGYTYEIDRRFPEVAALIESHRAGR
ncbi:MAG: lysophospholipid acyltransferase family protein [Actinobacteria bacterium]|nr:lysophospholipid acyltransferase family protein [Actinomycetota bacterium]